MSGSETPKYYSDALEKIFWKGYEFYGGNEISALNDLVIDIEPITSDLGVSKDFVVRWIEIVRKELGIKSN